MHTYVTKDEFKRFYRRLIQNLADTHSGGWMLCFSNASQTYYTKEVGPPPFALQQTSRYHQVY